MIVLANVLFFQSMPKFMAIVRKRNKINFCELSVFQRYFRFTTAAAKYCKTRIAAMVLLIRMKFFVLPDLYLWLFGYHYFLCIRTNIIIQNCQHFTWCYRVWWVQSNWIWLPWIVKFIIFNNHYHNVNAWANYKRICTKYARRIVKQRYFFY